jgi:hypothetical protein
MTRRALAAPDLARVYVAEEAAGVVLPRDVRPLEEWAAWLMDRPRSSWPPEAPLAARVLALAAIRLWSTNEATRAAALRLVMKAAAKVAP